MAFSRLKSRFAVPVLLLALALLLTQIPFFSKPTTAAGANLALGKSTAESGHADVYGSGNATDGNQGSYWESVNNAFPQWIRVDLGAPASVNQVVLKLPSFWETRTQTMTLAGSTDNSAYTNLTGSATYTFNPASSNTVTVNFTAATVRYIKITVTANTGWPAGQFSEIEVYGTASTPTPTPTPTATPTATPTPTPTATPTPTPTPTATPGGGDVVGKLIAGYQGWFNAVGDGSPNNNWTHWTHNTGQPAPGSNIKFELYPDLREYSALYQTGLGNLGNGTPAKLFSSYDQSTVNKHFEWMRTYNIDGAALQRFGADVSDSPDAWRSNRDQVAVKVKTAAEAYGRKFYVMYDISGLGSNWTDAVKHDFTTSVVTNMHLPSSSAYAKQNGKPVVCIWGIGFTHTSGDTTQSADLIRWFKDQGYYVIGGVPTYWRTEINDSKPGFLGVYKMFDMISPWFVGRFGDQAGADNFKNNQYQPDLAYCQQNGIDYQPVIFPGFAWSNMNPDKPRNEIPRKHGDFMWRQAYNAKSLGINSLYVAMFDEYDEGTAIAKAAENSSMAPTSQYFLTLDADGVAVSSDFYLRLTSDINKLLKGQIPLTVNHPTSHQ